MRGAWAVLVCFGVACSRRSPLHQAIMNAMCVSVNVTVDPRGLLYTVRVHAFVSLRASSWLDVSRVRGAALRGAATAAAAEAGLSEEARATRRELLEELKEKGGARTADAALYRDYVAEFVDSRDVAAANDEAAARARRCVQRLKQRRYSELSNFVNELALAAPPECLNTAPLVVFGAGGYAATKQGGVAVPTAKTVAAALARHFVVVLVDEYCTSKCCFRCGQPYTKRGFVASRCDAPDCHATDAMACHGHQGYGNRDYLACLAILRCFVVYAATGARPEAFDRAHVAAKRKRPRRARRTAAPAADTSCSLRPGVAATSDAAPASLADAVPHRR